MKGRRMNVRVQVDVPGESTYGAGGGGGRANTNSVANAAASTRPSTNYLTGHFSGNSFEGGAYRIAALLDAVGGAIWRSRMVPARSLMGGRRHGPHDLMHHDDRRPSAVVAG